MSMLTIPKIGDLIENTAHGRMLILEDAQWHPRNPRLWISKVWFMRDCKVGEFVYDASDLKFVHFYAGIR